MKTAPAPLLALSVALAGGATAAPPDTSVPRLASTHFHVTLSDTFLNMPKFDLPKGPYADVDAAVADLKNAADGLKAARTGYDQDRETCKTKSYTPQEIQQTCAGSDTVEACSEKLYSHCVALAQKKVVLAGERLQATDVKLDKAVATVMAGANKR